MPVRLLEAAIEFNVGKDTLYDFLIEKGFSIANNPTAKLTEEMYNAVQVEFAQDKNNKAIRDNITLPLGEQSLLEKWRKSRIDNTSDVNRQVNKLEISDTLKSEDMDFNTPLAIQQSPNIYPEKRRKRQPIENRPNWRDTHIRNSKVDKRSDGETEKQDVQKDIWRLYIQAKRKFIERLTKPIKIIPHSWELKDNGILKVEIDQAVDNEELYKLIRTNFTIDGVEPILVFQEGKLSHFTISTALNIDESKIEKFREQSSAFYLDFSALPVIEGLFRTQDSAINQFREFCAAQNIYLKKERDGKYQLTLSEIKNLENYVNHNPSSGIKIHSNIGCVIGVKPMSTIHKLVLRYGPKTFTETRTSEDGFSITSKSFNRNLFSEIQWIFRCRATYFIVTYTFNDELTEKLKTDILSKIKLHNDLQDGYLDNKLLIFKIPFNEINEGSIVFHTLYHYFSAQEINGKFQKVTIFYENPTPSQSSELEKDNLSQHLLQSLRTKLTHSNSLVNVSNNSISFDFSSEEELNNTISAIRHIDGGLYIDWRGQDHRLKVQIDFSSPFAELENRVRDRFRSAKTRYYEQTGVLQIKNPYKYSAETQNFIITQLKGFCEELAKEFGLEFTLINPYEIKLSAEINEKLKEYEETQKFQKLRMTDVSFDEKTIGKIVRCTYPYIEIKLSELQIDFFENIVRENKSKFTYIKPELKGEIEKIFRLEKAIEKIETDAKSLPNPKVADYIYDSSKAAEIKDPGQLFFGSSTWKEILFHKNDDSHLNDSQIRGIASSLLAEDLALIQGPPGTGKSTAIAEIIWQHIRRLPKQKILLTSETHMAVDNALEKIGKLKSNLIRPIRFGVDEDDFDLEDLSEDETVSKVENEGKRYSIKRMRSWASAEDDSVHFQKLKDNAIQIWLKKIANNSSTDPDAFPVNLREKWIDFCNKPTTGLRTSALNKYLEHVNVIGATSSSIAEKNTEGKSTKFAYSYKEIFASGGKNTKIKFDVVITDEASKATPPELLLPLLFGKKSIIVGDHRQLPPMLDENDFATTLKNIGERELAKAFAESNTNESQFERLFQGLHESSTLKTTFDLQYRMHSSINEVIKQFYQNDGGGLNCGLDTLQENSEDLYNPQSRWHGLSSKGFIDENTHCIWVNVSHPETIEGTSRVNWGEVDACRRILRLLSNADGFGRFQSHWKKNEDKEVGLISFYGKQLNHLKKIANSFPDIPLRISTVDRFQGMERNIIIVSMVRSNCIASDKNAGPDFETYPDTQGFPRQTSLGFAELPNRLNVALSRAKRLLIIVGNVNHFRQMEIYDNVYKVISASQYGKIIEDYKTLPE